MSDSYKIGTVRYFAALETWILRMAVAVASASLKPSAAYMMVGRAAMGFYGLICA